MKNVFNKSITIYNDVPKTAIEERRFDRKTIELCNVQGGLISKADGTIENVVNAVTVISKDIERYKSPIEYANLPTDLKENFYTLQLGDFVILADVDDVVTTSREFADLQAKYKDNGFVIRSVSIYINGLDTDNVQFANVG